MTELIDEDNVLFRDCMGPWDIEDRYEAFWNRLNASWETEFPEGKESGQSAAGGCAARTPVR